MIQKVNCGQIFNLNRWFFFANLSIFLSICPTISSTYLNFISLLSIHLSIQVKKLCTWLADLSIYLSLLSIDLSFLSIFPIYLSIQVRRWCTWLEWPPAGVPGRAGSNIIPSVAPAPWLITRPYKHNSPMVMITRRFLHNF